MIRSGWQDRVTSDPSVWVMVTGAQFAAEVTVGDGVTSVMGIAMSPARLSLHILLPA
jgi:hypothetical protein